MTTAETPQWPVEQCRTCRHPIIWTQTERGKDMPVDAEPAPGGTIALCWSESRNHPTVLSTVVTAKLAFGHTNLRKSHFASCPQAGKWRRRGGGRYG